MRFSDFLSISLLFVCIFYFFVISDLSNENKTLTVQNAMMKDLIVGVGYNPPEVITMDFVKQSIDTHDAICEKVIKRKISDNIYDVFFE